MNTPDPDPGDAGGRAGRWPIPSSGGGPSPPERPGDATQGAGAAESDREAAAFQDPGSAWAGSSGELREKNQSLWLLAASPTLWAAHFLLSYVTGAVWCARVAGRAGVLGPVRWLVAGYTVLALGGIGLVAWLAWKRHRYGTATVPHDFDTPEDRTRFLGFSTLLLSGLSAVAVVYVALVAVFTETCR